MVASFIDIVFDRPPGPSAGRFVEIENDKGESIDLGKWIDLGNGLWALRIPYTAATPAMLAALQSAKTAIQESANILRPTLPSFADHVLAAHIKQIDAALSKAMGGE